MQTLGKISLINDTDTSPIEGSSQKPIWLLNPAADLLFICGGMLWLIVLLSQCLSPLSMQLNSPQLGLLLLGAYVFSEPHFGASFMRAHSRGVKKSAFVAIALFGGLIVLTLASSSAITALTCKIYMLTVIAHYALQSLYVVRCYVGRSPNRPSAKLDLVLSLVMILPAAVQIFFLLAHPSSNSSQFLGLEMPIWPAWPTWPVQLCAILWCAAVVVSFAFLAKGWLQAKMVVPIPALLLILTNSVLFYFSLSLPVSQLWIYVPAFLHGAQSIALGPFSNGYLSQASQGHTSDTNGLDHSRANTNDRPCRLSFYMSSLLIGLVIMYVIPNLLNSVGFDSKLTYPAVLIGVSLFHFVSEMRNPFLN